MIRKGCKALCFLEKGDVRHGFFPSEVVGRRYRSSLAASRPTTSDYLLAFFIAGVIYCLLRCLRMPDTAVCPSGNSFPFTLSCQTGILLIVLPHGLYQWCWRLLPCCMVSPAEQDALHSRRRAPYLNSGSMIWQGTDHRQTTSSGITSKGGTGQRLWLRGFSLR